MAKCKATEILYRELKCGKIGSKRYVKNVSAFRQRKVFAIEKGFARRALSLRMCQAGTSARTDTLFHLGLHNAGK